MAFSQFPWSRYPSMERKPASRRRWLAGAGVAVALGLAGWWMLARWAGWGEARNRRQAADALASGDFMRARLLLEQAVQVNPRNLAARRELANFYELAAPERALARWREAVELEPERDEARLGLAGCALRVGDAAVARAALVGVSAAGRESAGFHRLAAGLALANDDRPALERHLAALIRLEPGDARARFNFAAVQIFSVDASVSAAGRATLVALARGDALRLRAVVELMRFAARTPPTEAAWDRLAREVLPPVAPADRQALLRHALAQPAPEANDAAVFIAWMDSIGLAHDALIWLATLAPAVQSAPAVRQAQAGCAVRQRDWPLLQTLVAAGVWGSAPGDMVTLAFAARVQHDGASAAHAHDTWDDALERAQRDLPALRVLLRLGEAWAWPDATKAALWRIAKNFPAETDAWRALAAGAEAESDSAEAWEVAQSWARARPADPAAQGRAQWVGVLLGKADAAQQADARASVVSSGGMSVAPTTVLTRVAATPESLAAGALLLARAGRASEALAALKANEAALATAPRAALIYGHLLAVAGPPGEAARWLAAAATVKLLPEERALLEQARALPNATAPSRATSLPATRP